MAQGKKYEEAKKLVDEKKLYEVREAIDLVKKTSIAKFDASVEVHIHLGIDPKKGDQQVRGNVSLPHGTGKTKKIAAFVDQAHEAEAKEAGAELVGGEELIKEIASSNAINFEVAVAMPAMMPMLAKIAKILGPRGLMPNPKNETVTNDIKKAVLALKSGKVTFKNDDTANVHQVIGKVSFDAEKLMENFDALMGVLKKAKPASSKGIFLRTASISASMGPGIKVKI